MDTTREQNANRETTWRPGRRSFLGLAGASAVAALMPGRVAQAAAPSRSAFAIDAAPGVNVHVGSGRLFPVTVLDPDGNELEKFERLSFATIRRVESPYFSVRSINPPRST